MKTFIVGILFSISLTLSATELNKYNVPMSQGRSSNFAPKTRGVIPNPAIRSFIPRSPRASSRQELQKVDEIIRILSSMEQSEVDKWLNIYQSKLNQAIESGKITEARYYHIILTKWRENN